METYVMRNPQKNYGRIEYGSVAGTLLATDYKSPPLVLNIEYDEEYGEGSTTD
jgi:hypothetical protein